MRQTVVVIGGGPAGLAAADAALDRGAAVVLLESAPRLGGQFWRHPTDRSATDTSLQHNWNAFVAMADRVGSDPSATVITSAQAWAIDHDHGQGDAAFGVQAAVGSADGPSREMITVRGHALIIATGAHDRTLPFPGWDLPGVVTGGAAQAMAKAEGIAVGQRVVVAGAGPFLLPVAASLAAVGARVIGVLEASSRRQVVSGWLPQSPWLAAKAPELAGYATYLARHRIPYRTGLAVTRAHGNDSVRGITVSRIDSDWRPVPGTAEYLDVDAVCVSHGFTPRLELAIAAGCALGADRFVAVDAAQRTSVPNVFCAGEPTGIGGSDVALAEGRIAGHVAAGGAITDTQLRPAVRRRRLLRRLTGAIRDAHRIGPGWTSWLTDDTVICRCEETSYGALRSTLIATRTTGLRPAKLTTRAGLGPCQGRICGRTVEELMTDLASTDGGADQRSDGVIIDRRPIASPVRFSELTAQARVVGTHEQMDTQEEDR
ncbi:pyridine nucleotide-disulfide oxidoreductase [Microlunatus endophyticus]|uniref:Pyridine nucleotide-disulfide oxidoreductase n=1 Tax=Microlunatus endophyticus TaxID=1716077 RepID=A0A917W1T6_9ACTN|nr:FAD-dependent oxidoreductase [Microlunatus endophyticus]GGL59079.1 pyridine nucleotide-disulfide oxidoreductase [Microlunatus endophyticus]